jgi:hypothetical protein
MRGRDYRCRIKVPEWVHSGTLIRLSSTPVKKEREREKFWTASTLDGLLLLVLRPDRAAARAVTTQ